MDAYQTLLNDLDAQIEQGLGLFEKKLEKAMDEPRETEEETRRRLLDEVIRPSEESAKLYTQAQSSPSILKKGLDALTGFLSPKQTVEPTFTASQPQITSRTPTLMNKTLSFVEKAAGVPIIEVKALGDGPRLSSTQRTERFNKLQTVGTQILLQTNKAGGTRRKRKGPTGNRTRIAGFKVLSAKPLHHKTKK